MPYTKRFGFPPLLIFYKYLLQPRAPPGFIKKPAAVIAIRHISGLTPSQAYYQSVATAKSSPLSFTSYPLPPPPPPGGASTPAPEIAYPQFKRQPLLPDSGPRRMDSSFYMRELSTGLIPYDSPEGKKIFKQALEEGGLEAFFPLSQQFLTQEEPAYCGIGTLCMILNALKIDPARTWRKPWRWFTQDMLDCCRPLDYVRTNGITLSEFTCLARCNGLDSNTKYADKISIDDFRKDVIASTNSSNQIMAVSYSRAALGQTGSGHFSPVGGYSSYGNAGGYVLILDVARFKYPSYWVSVESLYESLRPVDSVTKQPRGYSLLRRPAVKVKEDERLLLNLGFTKATWPGWFEGLVERVSVLGEDASVEEVTKVVGRYVGEKGEVGVGTRKKVLEMAVEALPTQASEVTTIHAQAAAEPQIQTKITTTTTTTLAAAYDPKQSIPSSQEYSAALTAFLTNIGTNTSSLYHKLPASPGNTPTAHALTTVLLLALYSFPPFLAKLPSAIARSEMEKLVDMELNGDEEIKREVGAVRRQMASLEACCREECTQGCGKGVCAGKGSRPGSAEGGTVA